MMASLPMYGIDPEAVERFWQALAAALRQQGFRDVPDRLIWPDALDAHWREPGLLLSQACGYPLVEGLGEAVQVVGAFHFAVEGCQGADYVSRIVVRADDPGEDVSAFRGRTAAYNGENSQSGYNAFRALVAPLAEQGRFFGRTVESGSHRRSLALVQSGEADIAAIDAVSFALIARADPSAIAGLRVLVDTAAAPGLPLITAKTTRAADLERLRAGIEQVIADPALARQRDALLVAGFSRLDFADYARCAAMKRDAVALGYPRLA